MKKESNAYIFLYASVLVIVSAIVLALASTALKPAQDANVQMEKRLSILHSVSLDAEGADAATNPQEFIDKLYSTYIVDAPVVNSKGERIEGLDAFDRELRAELAQPEEKRCLPLFVARLADSGYRYIFPLTGKGLWGPIWGYIALEEDMNTVYGIALEHKGETPGLGAEISTPFFTDPFRGKKVYRDGALYGIEVLKNQDTHDMEGAVDGISGGTMTSQGVQDMIEQALVVYSPYIEARRVEWEEEQRALEAPVVLDTVQDSVQNDAILEGEVQATPSREPAANTTTQKVVTAPASSTAAPSSSSASAAKKPKVDTLSTVAPQKESTEVPAAEAK